MANNCFHETGAVDNGIIIRKTCIPNIDNYEMIYNGPAFYVGNPLYKTPRSKCALNSDYDIIDLTIKQDIVQRTNYIPCINRDSYSKSIQGFQIGTDEAGNPLYDNFIDHYKVTLRCMLSQAGERTWIWLHCFQACLMTFLRRLQVSDRWVKKCSVNIQWLFVKRIS